VEALKKYFGIFLDQEDVDAIGGTAAELFNGMDLDDD
jgi:hypothetical protein